MTINKRCKDAHLQKYKTPTYFEHNEGDASRIHNFFSPVPLGSRCNLTSKKPTLFENHTMVLLYFVCVIINQFSAHLSSPVTIAHSLTRNFLKFVPKDRKNHRRKLQTNRQPSCFYPYEHLLALRTGGSRVPTYDQPPLIEARTQGWKLYSKCVKIYFER